MKGKGNCGHGERRDVVVLDIVLSALDGLLRQVRIKDIGGQPGGLDQKDRSPMTWNNIKISQYTHVTRDRSIP